MKTSWKQEGLVTLVSARIGEGMSRRKQVPSLYGMGDLFKNVDFKPGVKRWRSDTLMDDAKGKPTGKDEALSARKVSQKKNEQLE